MCKCSEVQKNLTFFFGPKTFMHRDCVNVKKKGLYSWTSMYAMHVDDVIIKSYCNVCCCFLLNMLDFNDSHIFV